MNIGVRFNKIEGKLDELHVQLLQELERLDQKVTAMEREIRSIKRKHP